MADPTDATLITGASSGIGAEFARQLAAKGKALVLVARRLERLEALAEELEQRHGARVELVVADLEDETSARCVYEAVAERGIAVGTLINNAGFGLRGRFARLPVERQLAMVRLNVQAVVELTGLFLPKMLERGQGRILNVASTAAFQAGPGAAVYYATKAFVLSFSEALSVETRGQGVTVTALCPGPVATEFATRADVELTRKFRFGLRPVEEVVRVGLAGLDAGRTVVVPGVQNKIGAVVAKLLPRAVVRRIAGKMQGV